MMGFLLFNPSACHVLMIGLGGGSLAKFIHRFMPAVRITVVEVNPHVIALRKQFHVPDDDMGFKVVLADAANFVNESEEQYDVVLADGFDGSGLPPQLSSVQFYDDCKNRLCEGGVMVANFHRCNDLFDIYVQRLESAFEQTALKVNDPGGTNSVAFAFKDRSKTGNGFGGMRRPESISEEGWRTILPSMARVFLAARDLTRFSKPLSSGI
jgi:spermidine synthase